MKIHMTPISRIMISQVDARKMNLQTLKCFEFVKSVKTKD